MSQSFREPVWDGSQSQQPHPNSLRGPTPPLSHGNISFAPADADATTQSPTASWATPMDTTSINHLFVKEAYTRGQYKIFTVHGSQDAIDAYVASYTGSKVPVTQGRSELAYIVDLNKVPEASLIKTWPLTPWRRKDGTIGFAIDLDGYHAQIKVAGTMPPAIGTQLAKEALAMLTTGVEIPAEYQQPTLMTVVQQPTPQPTGSEDLDAIFANKPDGIAEG